ncbi:MAG: sulfur carrier protein ThiS [Bacteroidales bacterium]
MTIYFNEEKMSVEVETTLFSVLEETKFSDKQGVAVAVNNNVVPRAEWQNFVLTEGANILVIQAAQGG